MKKIRIILITLCTFIICPTLIYAIYSDKQISFGNSFSASTLDIQLTGKPLKISIEPYKEYPVEVILTNIGKLNTTNIADIKYISGDIDFFNMIDKNIPSIPDLSIGESLNTEFVFTIDKQNYVITTGKMVKVEIHITSFEEGKSSGFSDTESLEVIITNESLDIPTNIYEILSETENV